MSKKEKFALYLTPEKKAILERRYQEDGSRSITGFIERAIDFYLDYLSANNAGLFLPTSIQSYLDGRVGQMENHLASLAYKQAVELDMLSGIIAVLYIGRIVLFREDEKAARVLHAALSDALEDDIFPDALGGGLVVTHGIAGAAVQEPVEPGTGSVCDAPHFEEQGPDTAHGKIPQDTRAGGAPADNDDCGFLHTLLQICHVKDIVMSHP